MSNNEQPHSWVGMIADGVAVFGDCILYAVSGDASAAGDVATIYRGQYPNAEDILLTMEAPANQHLQLHFGVRGIFMQGGIYVDMATNGERVVLVFDHVNPHRGED